MRGSERGLRFYAVCGGLGVVLMLARAVVDPPNRVPLVLSAVALAVGVSLRLTRYRPESSEPEDPT